MSGKLALILLCLWVIAHSLSGMMPEEHHHHGSREDYIRKQIRNNTASPEQEVEYFRMMSE